MLISSLFSNNRPIGFATGSDNGGNHAFTFIQNDSEERFRVHTNGFLGVNESAPTSRLHVNGDGLFTGSVTAASIIISSDINLKENITGISNALDKVLVMRGVEFNWKNGDKHATKTIGLIAQEVEAIIPNVVHTTKLGYKAIEYQNLVAVLIEAVKEMNIQIKSLEIEVRALKTKHKTKNHPEIIKRRIQLIKTPPPID